MIKTRIFFGGKDAPISSYMEVEEHFEAFVQQNHITREQIISISMTNEIWRGWLCYSILLVYEEEKEK